MRFFYVRLRTCGQYASMNEFTCSEHSVRVRVYVRKKKRMTGKQPLDLGLKTIPESLRRHRRRVI